MSETVVTPVETKTDMSEKLTSEKPIDNVTEEKAVNADEQKTEQIEEHKGDDSVTTEVVQSSEEPTKTTETKVDEELKTNETSDSDVDEHNDSETSEPANLEDDVQDKTNEEKENEKEVTLNGDVGEEYDVLHKIDTNDEYQVNFWKKTTVFAGFAIIVGYAIYHFNILEKYNIDFA